MHTVANNLQIQYSSYFPIAPILVKFGHLWIIGQSEIVKIKSLRLTKFVKLDRYFALRFRVWRGT
jgi:hypothetical protein